MGPKNEDKFTRTHMASRERDRFEIDTYIDTQGAYLQGRSVRAKPV